MPLTTFTTYLYEILEIKKTTKFKNSIIVIKLGENQMSLHYLKRRLFEYKDIMIYF